MRRGSTDKNQAEIVKALRKLGATVTSLHSVGKGCPDLLVGYGGETVLLEVKNSDTHARKKGGALTEDSQVEWLKAWRGGPAVVVYTVDEAIKAVVDAAHKRG